MWNSHLYPDLAQVLTNQGIYRYEEGQHYRLLITSRYAVWVECKPRVKKRKKKRAKVA
jgi:hypothetical protein